MLSNSFAAASKGRLNTAAVFLVACAFIALAVGGSLSLTSCATTEPGLQRETQLYLTTSNTVENVRHVVPYVPPPANGILEGVLAVGGALLALWATHLHRSLNEVRNGKPGSPASAGAKAAGTG